MGGSIQKAQLLGVFRTCLWLAARSNAAFEWLRCPRGAPDELSGLPQVGIHQVAVMVHRHCGSGMPKHALNHLRVCSCGQLGCSANVDERGERATLDLLNPRVLARSPVWRDASGIAERA